MKHNLDLTFFATGATQHVFVATNQPESGWIYKTPAAFGRYLPFRPGFRSLPPWNPYINALQLICYRLPSRWIDIASHNGIRSRSNGAAGWEFMEYLGRGFASVLAFCGDILLIPYVRRGHAKAFHRMLKNLQEISRRGLGDVLLPFEIITNTTATLRIGEAAHDYHGPMLIQRKAQIFFERAERLDEFDWTSLVEAQHRLWRGGFAFSDASEVLGPSNWVLLENRVLLGDTGCLTINYEEASRALTPDVLNVRQKWLLSQLDGNEYRKALKYFTLVRSEINIDRLTELWRIDAPDFRE